MAFGYYSAVSINSGQVPTTQTDFPVLVSFTDTRFKTVSSGGHVNTINGVDIRPYTDTTLTTAIIGYELERYNPTTGEVVMWVKVSNLSSSTTPFVLAYGNPTIVTDGSSTTTWSNNFLSVYHLKDGATLNLADSTGTNNLTNHGATAATGQIDGGCGFASASSQYVGNITFVRPVATTLSAWVNGTTFPNDYNMVIDTSGDVMSLAVKSNGKLFTKIIATGTVTYDGTGSHTLSTGTWYYLTLTYDSSAGLIAYVNAASDGTVAANGPISAAATEVNLSRQVSTLTRFFNGVIDEARICTIARSQDWITTEYNNQLAPTTFATLGGEVNASTVVAPSHYADRPLSLW